MLVHLIECGILVCWNWKMGSHALVASPYKKNHHRCYSYVTLKISSFWPLITWVRHLIKSRDLMVETLRWTRFLWWPHISFLLISVNVTRAKLAVKYLKKALKLFPGYKIAKTKDIR